MIIHMTEFAIMTVFFCGYDYIIICRLYNTTHSPILTFIVFIMSLGGSSITQIIAYDRSDISEVIGRLPRIEIISRFLN